MLTVEAMTGRAERFFQCKTQFPEERYPIVTVRDGVALGGVMFYRSQQTGIMGCLMHRDNFKWIDAESLAKIIEFPFKTLGVDTVITTFDGSPSMVSLCEKMGAVFAKDNSRKVIFTRENVLKAARVLRGEV